ncbi:MAG TPA: toll/interleukin-1 receptor domain-containing protein, partial [Thermoanaerobaculia bacterium]
MQIFLAHASEDKERVRELRAALITSGFETWLDEENLRPGENWQVEIPNAIRESDVFLACLSRASVAKHGFVQREFRLALNAYAEKPPGTIFLIPVKLDDCEVPDLRLPELGVNLRDIQWVDLWKHGGLHRLIAVIRDRETSTSTSEYQEPLPPLRLVTT